MISLVLILQGEDCRDGEQSWLDFVLVFSKDTTGASVTY